MEKAVQIKLLRELMGHIDAGTNVDAGGMRRNPTSSYTSPELAQREWEAFFRTHPQLIGLSGDLPAPGSFLTCTEFGVPILATRDADGVFHAFVNVCRHRGAIVEAQARGERAKFSCPFHGWTYSNRGGLVGRPARPLQEPQTSGDWPTLVAAQRSSNDIPTTIPPHPTDLDKALP